MRTTRILAACLLTALFAAPAASAQLSAYVTHEIRDPPPAYVAAGALQAGSGSPAFMCRTSPAPAVAQLAEYGRAPDGRSNYSLTFAVGSACGPIADSCAGQTDANGTIRGTCTNGATFQVRGLTYVPLVDAEGKDAGAVRFWLTVSARVQVPRTGERVSLAAWGELTGVRANA